MQTRFDTQIFSIMNPLLRRDKQKKRAAQIERRAIYYQIMVSFSKTIVPARAERINAKYQSQQYSLIDTSRSQS